MGTTSNTWTLDGLVTLGEAQEYPIVIIAQHTTEGWQVAVHGPGIKEFEFSPGHIMSDKIASYCVFQLRWRLRFWGKIEIRGEWQPSQVA
jgi:hypothetical protein